MRKKRFLSFSLITGLILAACSFITFWPNTVKAEYDPTNQWDYSRFWDSSYSNWGFSAQQPSFDFYSHSWQNSFINLGRSYNSSSYGLEENFLGALSQGSTMYIPPNSSFYENFYGGLGSPGAYLPPSQWPAYSYAFPSSPFGTYVFQPYPGGPIVNSLKPMTREEWWEQEIENHSLEHAEELAAQTGGPLIWLPSFSEIPPWEKQPIVIRTNSY